MMIYFRLFIISLLLISSSIHAQQYKGMVNDLLISKSNHLIWISDNVHSDVRGVSMINGKEIAFLPHQFYVKRIFETSDHIITVNDQIRFWNKKNYALEDSIFIGHGNDIALSNENTLAIVAYPGIRFVNLKTKEINDYQSQTTNVSLAKIKFSKDGKRTFIVDAVNVFELIGDQLVDVFTSKEYIKGCQINETGIHLLLSPNQFTSNENTSIKHISFNGEEINHIYLDKIPHLKIGFGELYPYNTSNYPLFEMIGSMYLVQTTNGIIGVSETWKQYLISGYWDLPYENIKFKQFGNLFARTDGSKITVLDLFGSVLYEENIESLYTSFNTNKLDKVSLLYNLYLIGNDGNKNIKHEFTWSDYLLPLAVTNEKNFVTFHKNGEVNVWDFNDLSKKYSWSIPGNMRPLSAIYHQTKPHIYCIFPDLKTVRVYDNQGKVILDKELEIESFPTSILSYKDGIIIGTSNGSVYKFNDNLELLSTHKNLFGEAVSSIAFIEDSQELLLGSRGRLIRCPLSIGEITDEQVTKVHTGYITDLSTQHFNGHDFLLTNSFFDPTALLWDLNTKSLIKSYHQDKNIQYAQLIDSLNVPMSVDSIGFTYDGNTQLVEQLDSHKPEVYLQSTISSGIKKILFSKDQNLILALSKNIVYILDMKTRKIITQIQGKEDLINDAFLDKNSRDVIITNGKNLVTYDIASGKKIREIDFNHVGNLSIHKIKKVPNTPYIFGINMHGWSDPYVIHGNSGKVLTTFSIPVKGNRIFDIQFSKSGALMAVYTNKEVAVFKDYFTKNPVTVFNYERNSEVSFSTMNLVNLDEEKHLVMFVGKVDGRTCTLVYDYENKQELKIIKDNFLAEIVEGTITYGYDNGIHQVNIVNDDITKFYHNKKFIGELSALGYNSKYDIVVGGDTFGNIKLFDNKTKNELSSLERFKNDIYNFRKYNNHIVYNHKQGLFYIDNKQLKNIKIDKASNYPFNVDLSEDENQMIYLGHSDLTSKPYVYIENLSTGHSEKLFRLPVEKIQLGKFLLRGNHIIYTYNLNEKRYFAGYDIALKKNYEIFSTEVITNLDDQSDQNTFFLMELTKDQKANKIETKLVKYDVKSGKRTKLNAIDYPLSEYQEFNKKDLQKYFKNYQLLVDKGYQIYQTNNGINIYDFKNKQFVLKNFKKIKNKLFKYHIPTNTLFIISTKNEVISYAIHDKQQEVLFTIDSNIENLELSEDELYILSSDEKISVYSLKDHVLNYQLQSSGNDGLSIINNEGYYMSDKGAVDNVLFKKGLNVYPYDQFDVWFNRPDLVLEGIEGTDKNYIHQAQLAFQKRLEKLKLSDQFPKIDALPTVAIHKDKIPVSVDSKPFSFTIEAKTIDQSNITTVDVWVNNVAIYGKKGLQLTAPSSNISKEITLTLNDGKNKVEVAVRSDNQNTSLKDEFFIDCESQTSSTFYVVSIGISHYKDSTMNLQYADKDARDIVSDLKEKGHHITPILLTNEEVTKEKILAIKEQLQGTQVDDKILLYYAGHGMLDLNYEYYLTTHDINFRQPQKLGLKYEDFIDILDGIPARKKLVIIDACHSGELDTSPTSPLAENNEVKIVSSYARGLVPKLPLPTTSSFEFMQNIFTDLRRDTGATIISSAGGNEYASEGEEYNNGLFTYYLRQAISKTVADDDKDNKVTVEELLNYVSKEVKEQSDGSQQPNARRINHEENFMLWSTPMQ
ncbi:caspase family protein [Flammeovirga sp. SubArs3]|uniref:caspase family protein n=1 Tax=Flammeovirga sp. SubArs3 TaxID=2995316 RepID=UPI00248BBFF7|nr:caspase family protein [Flammeovirga sp. SubArs3]